MTATEQWIKDGVAGGFEVVNLSFNGSLIYPDKLSSSGHTTVSSLLLTPAFWKAVAVTRGWEPYSPYDLTAGEQEYMGEWVQMMHDFIGHLADGLTIEAALSALEK